MAVERCPESEWSEQDKRIHNLTGFTPASREERQCTSCGQKGHYYYECNGGEFLKLCDAMVSAFTILKGE